MRICKNGSSLLPRPFFAGEEKWPGTICLRMRQITQNLGNSDTHVYFQCTSIVVFRCMYVYVHVWGYIFGEREQANLVVRLETIYYIMGRRTFYICACAEFT